MPGKQLVKGSQPTEYAEETNLAQPENDPEMNWFGLVETVDVTHDLVTEQIYEHVGDEASSLESYVNIEDHNHISVTLEGSPQNFRILEHFSGGTGYTTDKITPIQIGEQNEETDEYRRLLGCIGDTITITFDRSSVCRFNAQYRVLDITDWTDIDYVGGGSHATENTSEPFTFGDLNSITYGGIEISDAIQFLEFKVDNDVLVNTDVNSNLDSGASTVKWKDRKVTATLEVAYDDMSLIEEARTREEKDLQFYVGGVKFHIGNVLLEQAPHRTSTSELQTATYTTTPGKKGSMSFSWGVGEISVETPTMEVTPKVNAPPTYPPDLEPTVMTTTPVSPSMTISVIADPQLMEVEPIDTSQTIIHGLGTGDLGTMDLGGGAEEQL